MVELVSDTQRLTEIFAQATAPAFFLAATAGFMTLMSTRLTTVISRIRYLNGISTDDQARAHLLGDLHRLRRRARYLNSGIFLALWGAICVTLLLSLLFVSQYIGQRYAYGAGVLFLLSTMLLSSGLFRLAQEVRIGLAEAEEYD
jgi:hypothetical protein